MKSFPVLCLFLALVGQSRGGEFAAHGCSARWDESSLTVGNALFERRYAGLDRLRTVSFSLSDGVNLSAGPTPAKGEPRPLSVEARAAKYSPVGSEGLAVRVTCGGVATDLWIFPEVAGVLVVRPRCADIEKDLRAGSDPYRPSALHPRVVAFDLMDRTDGVNELCQTTEWLLHPCESPKSVEANILDVRDPLTEKGVVFLRLAPLPKSRPDKASDFQVTGRPRAVVPVANGYPVAELAYAGGDAGRTRALVRFQRAIRAYRADRDGLFLTNTWGDGNRDARINEAFLLQEVAAGADLGVDVIQIDDGWQKGRTANSASAKKGLGTWGKYWDVDPDFWKPCPERFPRGLEPIVAAARERGMKFGLWFGPDSSGDCRHWEKDAACLLDFHRTLGIDYFKMDSMVILTGVAAERQRRMFDRLLTASDGAMTFDLDCTANVRPGYFGLMDIGPLFVENRYIRLTDARLYYPHQTLRNLWKLSKAIDPVRLRMEVLNPLRLPEAYAADDPLAPAKWPADALFAITMCASPLGWFEISNLAPETVSALKPLVALWKRERAALHGGVIHAVGAVPDGVSWTGFLSEAADGSLQALLFRELNASEDHSLDLSPFGGAAGRQAKVLAGGGTAALRGNRLDVRVADRLGYVWVRIR